MELLFAFPVVWYSMFLIWHAFLFKRYQPKYRVQHLKVSVIIPVRNEEKNIKKCLQSIVNQDYPEEFFEIIVVDDHSTDKTAFIVKEFPRVKYVLQEESLSGKKAALATGIAHAQGDIILTTDGDTDRGSFWLKTMISFFFEEKVAVLSGPVKLEGHGIWKEMQMLEFAGYIVLGGGMIAKNRPSLCNGANLAYRKSVFLEVKGFEGIEHISSGDDELLLHKIQALQKYEIQFAKNSEAIVTTEACSNLTAFLRQRIRWVSKSKLYPDFWVIFQMIMTYFANLSVATSLFFSYQIFGILLGIKIFGEFIILRIGNHFLGQKKVIRWLIFEQVLHIFYILWIGIRSQIRRPFLWKDREVN